MQFALQALRVWYIFLIMTHKLAFSFFFNFFIGSLIVQIQFQQEMEQLYWKIGKKVKTWKNSTDSCCYGT